MATNARITKINAQNFHFDDKWVTPAAQGRKIAGTQKAANALLTALGGY